MMDFSNIHSHSFTLSRWHRVRVIKSYILETEIVKLGVLNGWVVYIPLQVKRSGASI